MCERARSLSISGRHAKVCARARDINQYGKTVEESKTSILMTALVMLNNNRLLLFLPSNRVELSARVLLWLFIFVNFFSFAFWS